MAYMYPDFIQSIIRDNGDKTYIVKMYEPMCEQIGVGVTNKFYSNEQGVDFGICGKNEALTWATVLEKALMKYRYIYWGSAGMGGIPQQETNPAFTGKGDEVYCWGPGKLTNEEMADELCDIIIAEMEKIAAMDQQKRYYHSTPEMLKRYAEMVPDVDGQK